MKRIAIAALAYWLRAVPPAAGEPAYTPAQAAACYPDAVRLCGAPRDWRKLGSLQKAEVIACMIIKQSELSQRCLAAFGR